MIKHPSNNTYIHYGHTKFDKNLFDNVENYGNKPIGGLWACDVDKDFGWKEFCIQERMYSPHSHKITDFFRFVLKPDAKVLHLEEPDDFALLPINLEVYKREQYGNPFPQFSDKFWYIDWKSVADCGVDAVEYVRTPYGHKLLNTWDFSSLVVLNPDIVEMI